MSRFGLQSTSHRSTVVTEAAMQVSLPGTGRSTASLVSVQYTIAGEQKHATRKSSLSLTTLPSSHNTLLAHGEVVSWYRNVFKGKGRISFKNSANNYIANTSSSADAAAVVRGNDFQLGWFNSPTWTTGDYPLLMRNTLGSLLPNFTAAQSKMLLGSCKWIFSA